MGDIGFGEMVAIAIIGLIVVGPDRLPQYAAQAARFVRDLRKQINSAKDTLIDAAAVDPDTLQDLRDLNPKRLLDPLSDTGGRSSKPKASTLDPDTT